MPTPPSGGVLHTRQGMSPVPIDASGNPGSRHRRAHGCYLAVGELAETITIHPTFSTVAGCCKSRLRAFKVSVIAERLSLGGEMTSLTVFFSIGSFTSSQFRGFGCWLRRSRRNRGEKQKGGTNSSCDVGWAHGHSMGSTAHHGERAWGATNSLGHFLSKEAAESRRLSYGTPP
jgi:hypothetical protein